MSGRAVVIPSSFFFSLAVSPAIYTLSLHDALPICRPAKGDRDAPRSGMQPRPFASQRDRKSTRLNSSHRTTSYAVFCLKKKIVHAAPAPPGGNSAPAPATPPAPALLVPCVDPATLR